MTVTRRAFGAVIALAVTACAPETTNPTASGPQPITELRIGLTAIGGERERAEILKGYEAYLEQRLGMPVRVYNASDYAGVAQAMEADQIELAFVGPSNYAGMALRMGDRIAPVLAPADASYYAILYVSAASPYRTLEDLRGKTLAFADVNSASGYLIPSSLLRQEGKDPAQFFGRTIFAGGHQQAIVAVMRGQADAGVTWSSLTGAPEAGYALGAPHMMVQAGLLKMSDLRIIWKAGPIPPGPLVANVRRLPPDLLAKIIEAHKALPKDDPAAFHLLAGGESPGFTEIGLDAYTEIIDMRRNEEAARRAR